MNATELEAKVSELVNMLTTAQVNLASLKHERDQIAAKLAASHAEIAAAKAGTAKAEAELEQFREMAVSALTPVSTDYKRAMKTLLREAESLREDLSKAQADTNERFAALQSACTHLEDRIRQIRRTFTEQLSAVLGTDADLTPAPMPRKNIQGNAGSFRREL